MATEPRKTNWLMIALIVLVAIIALQMFSTERAEQERRDRQNSLNCWLNDDRFYC